MAARDYTLLSKLGFADPDKKDPLHDLGCQYMAQESVYEPLLRADGLVSLSLNESGSRLEYPISKGEAQYKTTIGFIDVVVPYQVSWSIPIEVKIAPTTLGDMLRQITLYREYVGWSSWVLAVAFDISTVAYNTLIEQGVLPVRLGDKFRAWAAVQQAAPAAIVLEA